jgi:hypothetical protein
VNHGFSVHLAGIEELACNELDVVRASLPAEKAAAAKARGRELDVWETAESLLHELDGR